METRLTLIAHELQSGNPTLGVPTFDRGRLISLQSGLAKQMRLTPITCITRELGFFNYFHCEIHSIRFHNERFARFDRISFIRNSIVSRLGRTEQCYQTPELGLPLDALVDVVAGEC